MVYNNGFARPFDDHDFATILNINDGVGNTKYNIVEIDPETGAGIQANKAPEICFEDFTDGKGFTMLFSENLQALPWHRVGLLEAADLVMQDPNQKDIAFNLQIPNACAAQYAQGMVWHYEDAEAANLKLTRRWNKLGGTKPVQPEDVAPIHQINGRIDGNRKSLFDLRISDPATAHDLARPSSAHTAGVNAAFADGSTRFIDDEYRLSRLPRTDAPVWSQKFGTLQAHHPA